LDGHCANWHLPLETQRNPRHCVKIANVAFIAGVAYRNPGLFSGSAAALRLGSRAR
jgi:hypothetical protein